VKPLSLLQPAEAGRLRGVIFDLDDTVLDHGALTEPAFGALFRLREAGLGLVACTGRPAGWGAVIQRQWPLAATVTENGAVAWVPAGAGRVVARDRIPPAVRSERRAALLALASELVRRHPTAALADDNEARRSDVTIDIGEHRQVAPDVVLAMRAEASRRGVRSFSSSVHLHLTFDADDKASGTLDVLGEHLGEDPTAARAAWAFVGDSANDAAAFAAFRTTFGVANIARHARGLTILPRYVATRPMGLGFAEIAERLLALRGIENGRPHGSAQGGPH
jgi:HAD superfamily hydrolase (TIGR01484 family)